MRETVTFAKDSVRQDRIEKESPNEDPFGGVFLLKLTRSGFCKTDGAHHDGSGSRCGCDDAENQSGD